jgi:hypothetical protein
MAFRDCLAYSLKDSELKFIQQLQYRRVDGRQAALCRNGINSEMRGGRNSRD